MKKSSSCMISIQTDKNEKCLLVVGGHYGESPRYKQPGAQYTNGTTNEIHIFNVTTGKYILLYHTIKHHVQYFCVKMIHNNCKLS